MKIYIFLNIVFIIFVYDLIQKRNLNVVAADIMHISYSVI